MNDLQAASSRYLELLKGTLTDTIFAPELAVLRLDCDLYESTRDVLTHLYDRVSLGGFIIVDDYAVDTLFDCRAAVDEFRSARGILAPLEFVDTHCCSWRKPGPEVEGGGFTPSPGPEVEGGGFTPSPGDGGA